MLSKKQRKENQQIRAELRKQGIIPPKKKPLNRKKFVQEIINIIESDQRPDCFSVSSAVMMFFPYYKDGKMSNQRITDQQLTAVKIVHFAVLHERFMKEVRERGDTEYTEGEYYEKVYKKVFEL